MTVIQDYVRQRAKVQAKKLTPKQRACLMHVEKLRPYEVNVPGRFGCTIVQWVIPGTAVTKWRTAAAKDDFAEQLFVLKQRGFIRREFRHAGYVGTWRLTSRGHDKLFEGIAP